MRDLVPFAQFKKRGKHALLKVALLEGCVSHFQNCTNVSNRTNENTKRRILSWIYYIIRILPQNWVNIYRSNIHHYIFAHIALKWQSHIEPPKPVCLINQKVAITCLRGKFGINLPSLLFWNFEDFKISENEQGKFSQNFTNKHVIPG